MVPPEQNSDEIIELTDIIKKGDLAESGGSDDDVDMSFEQELEDLFADESDEPRDETPGKEPSAETPEEDSSQREETSLEDDLDALLTEGETGEAEPEAAEETPEPAAAMGESAEEADFEDELDALLAEEEQEPVPASAAPEEPEEPEEDDLEAELDQAMGGAATDEDIAREAGAGEETDDFEDELDALLSEDEPEEPAAPKAESEDEDDIDLSGLDDLAAELGEDEEAVPTAASEEDEDEDDIDLSGLDDLLDELDAEEKKGAKSPPPDMQEEPEPELEASEESEPEAPAEEDPFEAAMASAEASEEPGDLAVEQSMEAEEQAPAGETAEAPADDFEAAMAAAETSRESEEHSLEKALAKSRGTANAAESLDEITSGEEPASEAVAESLPEEAIEDSGESLDPFEAAMAESVAQETEEPEITPEEEAEPQEAEAASEDIEDIADIEQIETEAEELSPAAAPESLELGFVEEEEQPAMTDVPETLEELEDQDLEYVEAHQAAGETDLEAPPDLPPDTDLGFGAEEAAQAGIEQAPAASPELSGIMDRLEAMERRFSKELSRLQYRLDKAGAPEIEETELQDLEGVPGLEERLATLEGKTLAREDLEALRATIDYEIMARIEKTVPAAAAKVIREELDALIKGLSS